MTMATRALVPRADGEGSLGVVNKKWGNLESYRFNSVLMPDNPSINDAGKVLRLNHDVTAYEFVPAFLPEILGIEDEGKLLSIVDGNIAWTTVTLPIASTEDIGIVSIGANLNIDVDGLLSVPTATTSTPGVVTIGANLNIDEAGLLSAPDLITTTQSIAYIIALA